MFKNMHFVEETASTNEVLQEMLHTKRLPEGFVVYTHYQTAGKGQTGNHWESEKGKNILFSMVLYPLELPIDEQFLISQLVGVAIKKSIDQFVENVSIKWPNDLYIGEKKIGGILIENSWKGMKIRQSVIGVGLNINQNTFVSDAPNPVSLSQLTGKTYDLDVLLSNIIGNILELYRQSDKIRIRNLYHQSLYRKNGFFRFKDNQESFKAQIITVFPDGQLELETETGIRKLFYFKEVQFI